MSRFDKKFWTEGTGSIFLAIGIAFFIRWAFIEAYVIPSGSMLPSLLIHDHIFVNKSIYGVRLPFSEVWLARWSSPKKGDVIVFKYPENIKQYYIKRVIGVPGDRVFYENGNLYVNDELVEKRAPNEKRDDFDWLSDADFRGEGPGAKAYYLHWEESLGERTYSTLSRRTGSQFTYGPYTVPAGGYFVMGDNRDNSQDSRLWPPMHRFVPEKNLIGRAMFVWLSCQRTLPVLSFLCDPRYVRWSRFFHSVH